MNKPLYEVSVDPSSDEDNIPQRRLLYTNEDKKNYSLIDTGASVPIVVWKFMKKQSHIISDTSIPGCLPHSKFSQRFKLNVDSLSMSEKDVGLLYRLIEIFYSQAKLLDQTYIPVYHT